MKQRPKKKSNDSPGLNQLRNAAERGDAEAQCILGICYYEGKGVEQDNKEAVKWFRKAAEQGNACGQIWLGTCYNDGLGVKQDFKETVKWYRKAAELGEASAQNSLGMCYYEGNGVKQDYKKAVKWFKLAAEQGNIGGQYDLGVCYYEGNGVKQDYKEAVKWLKITAEQGNANAQSILGTCYYEGHGVKQAYKEAVKWFKLAGEQGDAVGQFWLGTCYYLGHGIKQDYKEAVKWFRLSAEQGAVAGQFRLGMCYYEGNGVKKNKKEAARWFNKAAEQDINYAWTLLMVKEYLIPLKAPSLPSRKKYREIPLPTSKSSNKQTRKAVPKPPSTSSRIQQMRRMERGSSEEKIFKRQGMFMADYDDEMPWTGDFHCYWPTYMDLSDDQLRGYFHWRGCIRRGDYQPIPLSATFIYIYELLNGIGTSSPEESLQKIREFEVGYLDSGIGDSRIRRYLHPWMMALAMIHALPLEVVLHYTDLDLFRDDQALIILRSPDQYADEDIVQALSRLAEKKLAESPVLSGDFAKRGKHLLSEMWRNALTRFHWEEKDLFTLCFGERKERPWYFPLRNAVFDWSNTPKKLNIEYIMNECRIYRCRHGEWTMDCFAYNMERLRFLSFIHAADLRLRRYLETGHYLHDSEKDTWVLPFINEVIEADKRAVLEAARPKISINPADLNQIRKDALITRNSLLSEDERAEMEEAEKTTEEVTNDKNSTSVIVASSSIDRPEFLLDNIQIQILRKLLHGESVRDIIKKNRLMPSMVADAINEALFDEIGDTVLSCEDDVLSLVDDYRSDIKQILGDNKS